MNQSQEQIYQYIKRFINQYGQSPTIDNLIRNLGYERHTIKKTINALVEKGYLEREKRSIILGVLSVE
jgi:DNA-binding GntR family transcriptional regulator